MLGSRSSSQKARRRQKGLSKMSEQDGQDVLVDKDAPSHGVSLAALARCFMDASTKLGISLNGWKMNEVLAHTLQGEALIPLSDPRLAQNLNQNWVSSMFEGQAELVRQLPVRGVFSHDPAELKAFLAQYEMHAEVRELAQGQYGLACALRLAAHFRAPSLASTLVGADERHFAGVYLREVPVSLPTEIHPFPIAMLDLDHGMRLFLSECGDTFPYGDTPALFKHGRKLVRVFNEEENPLTRPILFPKVKLEIMPNLFWLEGLEATTPEGERAEVKQGIQTLALGIVPRYQSINAQEEPRRPGMLPESLILRRPFFAVVTTMVRGKDHVAAAFRVGTSAWTQVEPQMIDL